MSNGTDERRKAMEEGYFKKKNDEALKRIAERESDKPRLSPITGEPMEQLTIMGVVIDKCPTSHGIWLDSGELEEIIEFVKGEDTESDSEGLASRFFSAVFNKE